MYYNKLKKLSQFSREMLKNGTFCRENVVYGLWVKEKLKNLCGERTPRFIPPCTLWKSLRWVEVQLFNFQIIIMLKRSVVDVLKESMQEEAGN